MRSEVQGGVDMMRSDEIRVAVEPAGIGADLDRRLRSLVQGHPRVREFLGEAEFRLLNLQPIERGVDKESVEPDGQGFLATLYDYSNDRTLEAVGRLDAPEELELSDYHRQPLPSAEEFEAAVAVLAEHSDWGGGIGEEFDPMPHVPPVIALEQSDGRMHRTIGVVLVPRDAAGRFVTPKIRQSRAPASTTITGRREIGLPTGSTSPVGTSGRRTSSWPSPLRR